MSCTEQTELAGSVVCHEVLEFSHVTNRAFGWNCIATGAQHGRVSRTRLAVRSPSALLLAALISSVMDSTIHNFLSVGCAVKRGGLVRLRQRGRRQTGRTLHAERIQHEAPVLL